MAFMSLNGIDVSYDKKKQILKGLNLEVEEGELVSLLGPSGCGKSTTLRVVAGFIDPQGGTFTLDGEDMTKVPVHKRQFGLVFQSYALFPQVAPKFFEARKNGFAEAKPAAKAAVDANGVRELYVDDASQR